MVFQIQKKSQEPGLISEHVSVDKAVDEIIHFDKTNPHRAHKNQDHIGMNEYEFFEITHLKRFFSQFNVDCVFDVGANAGQYASMLRHKVGFGGTIISFEPIPQLAHTLRSLSETDPNWHIFEVALDRHAREAVFNVMASDQFSSLKAPRHTEVSRFFEMNSVSVELRLMTTTLAIEFPKLQSEFLFSRPFLKMDTQGNDVEVFEGAGNQIEKFVGLQSELSIRRIYEDTLYFDDVLRRYAERGFVLSALVPNNAGHFPDLIEIDCIMYRA